MSGDEKIKAAVQEILEVARKYDLAIYFSLCGRTLGETRWRFPTWSCFEQASHEKGSMVHFRTRVGGTGERRPHKDIEDSVTIARHFAQSLAEAAIPALGTYDELKAKFDLKEWGGFLGATPPWDLK